MQASVYTRDRKRKCIGSIWSRVTCLALPLAAAQSLGSQVFEDSQSNWRLTIATGNKQLQKNKYTVQERCLDSNQIVPKDATRRYECMSARIT
jgi:hypothetical protein